jgi:hypothetical protein
MLIGPLKGDHLVQGIEEVFLDTGIGPLVDGNPGRGVRDKDGDQALLEAGPV